MNIRLQWLINILGWLMWLLRDLDQCTCGSETVRGRYKADGVWFDVRYCTKCGKVYAVNHGKRIDIKRWGMTA